MKRRKWRGGRAVLNLPGFQSTAAIVAEIEDTGPANATQQRRAPAYTLQVSNCDRALSFDLDGFDYFATVDERREAFENDLHKLDTLIDALTKFRAGLALEHRRLAVRRRRSG